MAGSDAQSKAKLKQFENLLADQSYIKGYAASEADLELFETIDKAPESLVNLTRWYNHIAALKALGHPSLQGGKGGKSAPQNDKANDDDDVDLFGSDEEDDAEAAKVREERLAAYAAKKSKKPALIAKSSVLLDVKPWDDETDMKIVEQNVRSIEMDGLLWGVSKLVPVGYGINKLQILCVIEDEKVSIDLLTETIEEFKDHVQSVDIAAFNKI